jgi:hypothetical protein
MGNQKSYPARRPVSVASRIAWLMAFATWMALVIGGVFYARSQALLTYGSQEAQVQWDRWREDAKAMAGSPVQRREPKSAEPPALVLMRDYFAVCLIGAVLLSSVLFGTFMVLVRGAMSDGGRVGSAHR